MVQEEEFAIVFAAMGVNMETAHFFKQVTAVATAVVVSGLLQPIALELHGRGLNPV